MFEPSTVVISLVVGVTSRCRGRGSRVKASRVAPLAAMREPRSAHHASRLRQSRARRVGAVDRVFRTYFINSRGDEALGSTWSYLDMTALGRQEEWEDSPEGYPQTPTYEWWIWHDEPATRDADRPGLVQLRIARASASTDGDPT